MNLETVKVAVELSAPIITAYLDSYAKPLIESKIATSRKRNYSFEFLEDYLKRSYERFGHMRTIAFGDSSCKLIDLYEPLEIVHFSEVESIGYLIDGLPVELLHDHRRVVIRDSAGMGKSTLTKYIFLQSIHAKLYIPIYVELRKIRESEGLVDFIKRELGDGETSVSQGQFNDLIRTENVVIFFDGYDEVRNDLKEFVTESIIDFSSRFRSTRIILTSRDDSSLPAFGGYKSFHIVDLTYHKACALLKRYGEVSGKNIHKELIAQLDGMQDSSFRNLLENPLIVSLLFKAYDYRHKIPLSKSAFYNQVYDALFEGHDLSKEGYERERLTGLDKYAFEEILKIIAFKSIKEGPSYDRGGINDLVEEAIASQIHFSFKPTDFILDVLRAVPLMIEDGHEIRWTHKSFQEYFCARYICTCSDERKEKILGSMFFGSKSLDYKNVIEMLLDMDRSSSLKIVVKPFIDSLTANFQAIRIAYPWLSGREASIRAALTLKSAYTFTHSSLNEKHDTQADIPVLSALSGDMGRKPQTVRFAGSEDDSSGDDVRATFILSHQIWLFETMSRMEIFKGLENVFEGTDSRDSYFPILRKKEHVVIPPQSDEDKKADYRNYYHYNTLMITLNKLFGNQSSILFMNLDTTQIVSEAINDSIDKEPTPMEDDFS